jgi:hypothetical protein
LKTDGKAVMMKYLGFEKENEAVYTYLEADNISSVKRIDVTILFYMIYMMTR